MGPFQEAKEFSQACTSDSCNYIKYHNPTPVVGAIVQMGDEVVLARGKGWPEKMFALVTGFLEKEEKPEEAVLREVKEELNLDAELVSMVGIYPFAMMNQLLLVYHLTAEGQITINEELEEYKLVPINKLRPWPLGTGEAVQDWLANHQEAAN